MTSEGGDPRLTAAKQWQAGRRGGTGVGARKTVLVGGGAVLAVGFEVGAEALDHRVFLAVIDFFLDFFECEVDYVVVVKFLGGQDFAEAQPEAMQEIDFISG